MIFRTSDEWEKTFDAISDMVTIQDSEMRIVRANRAAHEMFGLETGSLIGKTCYAMFQGRKGPCEGCPVEKTRGTCAENSGHIFNERLQKVFDVRTSPIRGADGSLEGIIQVARDITRQDALERQLQQSMKMEAIGTLAGGIAHDFNNILSAIIGYGHIARDKLEKGSPVLPDIDQILSGADRAVELVKQILTFARQEKNQRLSPMGLQHIIKEVLKLLRSSLPATIELHQKIDNGCGAVMADPGQIHQLFMNLCTNAKQAIGGGHGRITVTLREADGAELAGLRGLEAIGPGRYVYLGVSDSGCGMGARLVDRIFEPFFTTRSKEHGTGLGLAVVHGIVKRHQGEIGVESLERSGTTFHLAFPLAGVAVVAAPRENETPTGGSERIMVVDDEPPVAGVLKAMLIRLGYRVIVHHDSLEAVRQFRCDPRCCDLVLTDMTMPAMTGSELAREMLSLRPDLPVVMLTGYSESIDRSRAMQTGIREFLFKPVKKESLARALREVLDCV